MTKKSLLSFVVLLAAPLAQGVTNDVEALKADLVFFTDASCSQLKTGIKQGDLPSFKSELLKSVAVGMLNATYNRTYRAASYEAYPSPSELGRTLKLGDGFSRYENITGMYLEAGENVVFMGNTDGKALSLLIPRWMRKPPENTDSTKDPNGWGLHRQEIGLKEGVNVIHVEKAGNVYVSYFDDHAEQAPKVTVHFPTGKVNGYTRSKGKELINNYDVMLHHHYSLLGLVKYKKVPKNRILARVNFNYYMFRDGDGVAYLGNKGTMGMVADPGVVIKGDPCWGFCHEVGHALQLSQITRIGKPDFYADVMEKMRNCPDAGSGDDSIRNQFEFVKLCCDVAELDLTDFFDTWGFFWTGQVTVDDYRKYHYTITQQMVDDTKTYIANKKFKKPDEDISLVEE